MLGENDTLVEVLFNIS